MRGIYGLKFVKMKKAEKQKKVKMTIKKHKINNRLAKAIKEGMRYNNTSIDTKAVQKQKN